MGGCHVIWDSHVYSQQVSLGWCWSTYYGCLRIFAHSCTSVWIDSINSSEDKWCSSLSCSSAIPLITFWLHLSPWPCNGCVPGSTLWTLGVPCRDSVCTGCAPVQTMKWVYLSRNYSEFFHDKDTALLSNKCYKTALQNQYVSFRNEWLAAELWVNPIKIAVND